MIPRQGYVGNSPIGGFSYPPNLKKGGSGYVYSYTPTNFEDSKIFETFSRLFQNQPRRPQTADLVSAKRLSHPKTNPRWPNTSRGIVNVDASPWVKLTRPLGPASKTETTVFWLRTFAKDIPKARKRFNTRCGIRKNRPSALRDVANA